MERVIRATQRGYSCASADPQLSPRIVVVPTQLGPSPRAPWTCISIDKVSQLTRLSAHTSIHHPSARAAAMQVLAWDNAASIRHRNHSRGHRVCLSGSDTCCMEVMEIDLVPERALTVRCTSYSSEILRAERGDQVFLRPLHCYATPS